MMRYLLLGLAIFSLSSCSIGVREEKIIIYASIAKTPESVSGIVRIASNEKIPVTVSGHIDELDLGGYYAVSAADLETMIKALKGNTDAP